MIIIVEDSPVQAEMLRRALQAAGYEVMSASNGAEGLALAKAHTPSAVLSDINMPIMDGYAMCQAMRHEESLQSVPVILLTMLSDPEDVIRGLNAGADAYLTKPYNVSALLARIESLLANPRAPAPATERRKLEVRMGDETYPIDAHAPRMLSLLVSTYENAVLQNRELTATQNALEDLNMHLEQIVLEKTTALRASEALNRAILDSVTAEIAVLDPQGIILAVNEPWRRFALDNAVVPGQPPAQARKRVVVGKRVGGGGGGVS